MHLDGLPAPGFGHVVRAGAACVPSRSSVWTATSGLMTDPKGHQVELLYMERT